MKQKTKPQAEETPQKAGTPPLNGFFTKPVKNNFFDPELSTRIREEGCPLPPITETIPCSIEHIVPGTGIEVRLDKIKIHPTALKFSAPIIARLAAEQRRNSFKSETTNAIDVYLANDPDVLAEELDVIRDVAANGLITPVTVMPPDADGYYTLVDGVHRLVGVKFREVANPDATIRCEVYPDAEANTEEAIWKTGMMRRRMSASQRIAFFFEIMPERITENVDDIAAELHCSPGDITGARVLHGVKGTAPDFPPRNEDGSLSDEEAAYETARESVRKRVMRGEFHIRGAGDEIIRVADAILEKAGKSPISEKTKQEPDRAKTAIDILYKFGKAMRQSKSFPGAKMDIIAENAFEMMAAMPDNFLTRFVCLMTERGEVNSNRFYKAMCEFYNMERRD